MKILITGASGFIGGRLLQTICDAYGKNNVIAFSSQRNAACETIIYGNNNYQISKTDIVKLEQIELLIHAGAFMPKNGGETNAILGCNSNISYTEKLLNLPFSNLKKIIYLSTVDVYQLASLINESTPTLPKTLYGMSKLYCESIVNIYAKSNKIDCQILRIGHVYGPGEERFEKFLPRAIKSIVGNMPIELWGDGAELRSFIYIDDVVLSIMRAINLSSTVGVINVVGSNSISIRQLLDTLCELSGKKVEVIYKESNFVTQDYIFDSIKLKNNLLFQEYDFLMGLRAEYSHIENLK